MSLVVKNINGRFLGKLVIGESKFYSICPTRSQARDAAFLLAEKSQ